MSDEAPSHALQATPAPPADVHSARPDRKSTLSAGATAHALSAADVHHVHVEQRRFMTIYAVLVIGTAFTVAMYYVHFEEIWQAVTVALFIATVKALCVAAVFMHLWHGERDVYRILAYTGVVVLGLFVLTIFSIFSVPGSGLYLR